MKGVADEGAETIAPVEGLDSARGNGETTTGAAAAAEFAVVAWKAGITPRGAAVATAAFGVLATPGAAAAAAAGGGPASVSGAFHHCDPLGKLAVIAAVAAVAVEVGSVIVDAAPKAVSGAADRFETCAEEEKGGFEGPSSGEADTGVFISGVDAPEEEFV